MWTTRIAHLVKVICLAQAIYVTSFSEYVQLDEQQKKSWKLLLTAYYFRFVSSVCWLCQDEHIGVYSRMGYGKRRTADRQTMPVEQEQ